MLLAEPAPTPMDLRFRLFGTPVRVHPFFWLFTALLGWSYVERPEISDNGMLDLAIWILACFLSILLHEFGHVWMGKAFGSEGHIVLHSMGGLAIGSNNLTRGWQRVLVSAAGPGIQLLLWGGLKAMRQFGFRPDPGTPLWLLVDILLDVNWYWPLLNLLPIWPLDGGQITMEICAGISRRKGALVALWISLVVSAVLAVNGLMTRMGKESFIPYAPTGMFISIFFALFAIGSWQLIQAEQQTYRNDDYLPWER